MANTYPTTGNYEAVIVKHELGMTELRKTPLVRFFCKLTSPTEDVDEVLFRQAGGAERLNTEGLRSIVFHLVADQMDRFGEFLENTLGISCEGKSFVEALPETTDKRFIALINGHTIIECSRFVPNPNRVEEKENV